MHLALVALDVGPGDEVITSPITWPATANVIEHCGATPVFCDVREDDLNLDPALLPTLVNERTKAILPVHLAGQPCDLDPIHALGLPVVEDAAHALESRYRGRKLGGLSDAPLLALRNEEPRRRRGRADRDEPRRRRRPHPEHAAHAQGRRFAVRPGDGGLQGEPLGRARGDRARPARQARGARRDPLAPVPALRRRPRRLGGITPLARDARDTHALHLYAVRIDPDGAGATRDEYQRALAEERIATSIHFLPVHRLTWFRERYPDQPRLPVAERAGDEVLSLPLSPAHSVEDIEDAIDAVRRVHARLAA